MKHITRTLRFIASCLILVSCGQPNTKDRNLTSTSETEKVSDKSDLEVIDFEEIQVTKITDTSKVFEVKKNGVFIIQLTTKESDSLENADEKNYEVISERANNASTNALELLNSLKIEQYWSDKRYVKYLHDESEIYLDTRKNNKVKMDCCILFKTGVKPMIIEVTSIDQSVMKNYFKI